MAKKFNQICFEDLNIGSLIYDLTGSQFGKVSEEQSPEMQWLHTIIESIEFKSFIPDTFFQEVEEKIEGMRETFSLHREVFD